MNANVLAALDYRSTCVTIIVHVERAVLIATTFAF